MDQQLHQDGDEGFSLIEVVVALGMLAVVSSAALAVFLGGLSDAARLERRQSAVMLASAAVEGARSASPTMTSSTSASGTTTTYSGLVRGRTAADVTSAWDASTAPGRSVTFPMSDPTATSPGPAPVVPISTTSTVAGQAFTTSVLIGSCYRLRSDTSAPCDKGPSGTRTSTPPTGYVEVVRVIATTSWTSLGRRGCTSTDPCSYTTAVLVDPGTDPVWSTSAGDAVDDVATVQRGATTSLNVLANDTVAPASSSPVSVTSQPVGATARAETNGTITLTVPAGTAPGQIQLQYTVTNSAGSTTAPAVVRITVTS